MNRKLLIVLVNTDPRNPTELGAPFYHAAGRDPFAAFDCRKRPLRLEVMAGTFRREGQHVAARSGTKRSMTAESG